MAGGGAERRRKVPPARDNSLFARCGRDADEHGLHAQRSHLEPELIILGHAGAGEGSSFLQCGNPAQGTALDRAANAGQRDSRSHGFPDHQFLDVGFGKFVAIMAGDPAGMCVDQRQNGELDHRGAVDQPIENPQLETVNNVFGIVQYNGLRLGIVGKLIVDQRIIEVIEAVGFRRWPVLRDLHWLEARVDDAGDCGTGRGIVPVIADEDPVIVVVEARQHRPEHRRNDRCFIPGGDQNCDQAGVLVEDIIAGVGAGMARVDRKCAPRAPGEIDKINEQVVDSEQQEPDTGEQRQLGREATENFANGHARIFSRGLRTHTKFEWSSSVHRSPAANQNNRAGEFMT